MPCILARFCNHAPFPSSSLATVDRSWLWRAAMRIPHALHLLFYRNPFSEKRREAVQSRPSHQKCNNGGHFWNCGEPSKAVQQPSSLPYTKGISVPSSNDQQPTGAGPSDEGYGAAEPKKRRLAGAPLAPTDESAGLCFQRAARSASFISRRTPHPLAKTTSSASVICSMFFCKAESLTNTARADLPISETWITAKRLPDALAAATTLTSKDSNCSAGGPRHRPAPTLSLLRRR